MNQRLLIIWAVGASVVALSALSYIAGKQAGSASIATPAARPASDLPYSDPGRPDATAPAYVIPATLAAGPSEWRTVSGKALTGYAALFEPASREVIVEQCLHRRYQLDEQGRPVALQPEFCTPVLWAQLVTLTETTAVAVARDGREIELRVDARFSQSDPTLRLRFDEHDVRMIPGSKNDLLQTMERHPTVMERKQRYLLAMVSAEDQERAALRSLPAFTVPATQDATRAGARTD